MAAAAATRTLKVATGVCLIIERDTIVTAKEVASLDALSNGRFLFGIGAGWNAEEMENHGTEFRTRFRKMEEQVAAMKAIWTRDEPEFHGRFVRFDPIWCWPKPLQKPHPPIHLGGTGSRTLQRVADFCDGWMPIARGGDPRALTDLVPELRERIAKAGRKMSAIELSVFGPAPEPAAIDRFRDAGFDRAILRLPSSGRDEILPLLDRHAKLVAA
jgi:probable F420-dependent oxidoreductase